jgi:hypothetical protein
VLFGKFDSFFLIILLKFFNRSKVSELEAEIQRLQRETDSFTEDNKQYFALSKALV